MSVKNKINSINLWLKKNTSIDEQILSIKKFETGQSNPTFLLKSDNKSFVLRAKPKLLLSDFKRNKWLWIFYGFRKHSSRTRR